MATMRTTSPTAMFLMMIQIVATTIPMTAIKRVKIKVGDFHADYKLVDQVRARSKIGADSTVSYKLLQIDQTMRALTCTLAKVEPSWIKSIGAW
jgi:hypothetical protein